MDVILQMITDTKGDASRHLPSADLENGLKALAVAPADSGTLTMIVRSPATNAREILARTRLSTEDGLPGDKWGQSEDRQLEAQLTVMHHHVAELIANGQSLALFGDNLFLDLDIAEANLPAGSQFRVGGAILEVTPLPHNGCGKFTKRFGNAALRFVNAAPTRHLNLRGICCRVIESGDVEVGSKAQVLSRPVSKA